ncbi:MAG TPA: PqqD family peptide modification chaperone [Burkholderiales bacterium]|nr:PqqD family peptide modification chaperone [Burkholderiales bacterium]
MTTSLFSSQWYRVAEHCPQLRGDVRIQRQDQRDQRWYVLSGALDANQLRINEQAWRFVGRCDGTRTVQQIWDALLDEFRDEAPTQDEVLRLLGQLDERGLIAHDAHAGRQQEERARPAKGFVNPLALRIPLGDPSRLLDRLGRLPDYLFNMPALWIWIVVAVAGLLAAASDWNALALHARQYMGTPRYLALAWIVFPFLKLLHELAHALAVRRWGGRVREAGFSLFVLVPAPYVDASAANAFRSRHQRAIVGLAGIMAEFVVATIALVAWFNVQPGLVRDIAFVTMFIAGVSTVLFNGNPLLRFDAYYVLCDALDLPNLASRSRRWWMELAKRLLLGGPVSAPLVAARGERKWLIAYAPLSHAYRLFVSGLMVLWLGAHSFLVGSLAALLMVALLIVKPAWSAIGGLLSTAGSEARRGRAMAAIFLVAMALAAVLCLVPLPYHTVASAVVTVPDKARLRPAIDGFIVSLPVADGARVAVGQPLLVLEDPALQAEREKLESQLERLQAGRFSAVNRDPGEARNAEEEIQRVQGDLKRAEEKIEGLVLRAQVGGVLVMPHQQDLPGTFVHQGTTVGYVLEQSDIRVRAAVPEFDAPLVRESARAAEVRTAETGNAIVAAQIVRDIPAATTVLPSVALGDRGGGAHVTDPADADGLRTLEPIVLVDLTLPSTSLRRVGGRAWVRFDHGFEPLAQRWYRQLRQLLLQHFNPVS